jgi:hypothetical protein
MISWNLHQAHFQEVGLTQIPRYHDFKKKNQDDKFQDTLQGKFQDRF